MAYNTGFIIILLNIESFEKSVSKFEYEKPDEKADTKITVKYTNKKITTGINAHVDFKTSSSPEYSLFLPMLYLTILFFIL